MQLTKGSALELINLSESENRIVCAEYNDAKAAELLAESSDSVFVRHPDGDVTEYWGTCEDGDTETSWRVHLHH
jgi:hypothetical protein